MKMYSDGMQQDFTTTESADNPRIIPVYTGRMSELSADFSSVQFWCIPTYGTISDNPRTKQFWAIDSDYLKLRQKKTN